MNAPIETKVKASTAASALAGLALWALGRYVFKGSVPDVVASWTYAIIPAVITFGAGYLAKHTDRPAPEVGWVGPRIPAPVAPPEAPKPVT